MRIPVSWLRDYVSITAPMEDIARRLTMAGLEVEAIERTGGDWDRIVVGHVQAVRPHPNADRLRLVTVDAGNEPVEVVCGAPNVAEGQKIAYAAIGASLIDGHTGKPAQLKPAKIRGVVSHGMVCSERELGISDQHEGILVLDPDAPIGRPVAEVLGDVALDIKVSPNRPDCLSVMGIAREIAALTGTKVTEPATWSWPASGMAAQRGRRTRLADVLAYPETEERSSEIQGVAQVRIDDPDLCRRYTASVITGVKVGPSPQWLVDRLKLTGQNAINNVVDVTNYVLFEMGQPLHAFNLREVGGRTVIVRRAKAGEKLLTLDGGERTLPAETLVIADTERAIGLAGVIGGLRSGINEATTDILLESANFDQTNNRRTQAALGLRTEATIRFEKGLRPELAEYALKRATRLIQEICGGEVARGWIDVWPGRQLHDPSLMVTRNKLSQVLGVSYQDALVEATLTALGCGLNPADGGWRVVPPYWRSDITIVEDVAEELARVIGYDTIPTTVISGELPRWSPNQRRDVREKVRDSLVAFGMQEIVNYSLTTRESMSRVRPPAGPAPLTVANPMSADMAALRTTLREGVLRTLSRNTRTWRGPIALFECARVYLDQGEGLPEEREMAVGALVGPRQDPHWSGESHWFDFSDARGAVEAVLGVLGLAAEFSALPQASAASDGSDATFADGRCAAVTSGGRRVGVVGEVAADVLAAFDCESSPVAMFELDVEALADLVGARPQAHVQFRPFGRYPESVRDISIVVDATVEAGQVLAAARRARLVVDATLFDEYLGKGLPSEKKALGLRVVYQAPDRTLTSDEIDRAQAGILRSLEREFDAVLRA